MSISSRVSWIEMVSFHPQNSWEFFVFPLNVIPLLHELPVVRIMRLKYIYPSQRTCSCARPICGLMRITKAFSTFLFKIFNNFPSHLLLVFSQILFVIVAFNPFVAFGVLTWIFFDSRFTLVEKNKSRKSRPYKNNYCTRSLLEWASSRLWWPTTYRWFNMLTKRWCKIWMRCWWLLWMGWKASHSGGIVL
jgi:hypothetical protein